MNSIVLQNSFSFREVREKPYGRVLPEDIKNLNDDDLIEYVKIGFNSQNKIDFLRKVSIYKNVNLEDLRIKRITKIWVKMNNDSYSLKCREDEIGRYFVELDQEKGKYFYFIETDNHLFKSINSYTCQFDARNALEDEKGKFYSQQAHNLDEWCFRNRNIYLNQ